MIPTRTTLKSPRIVQILNFNWNKGRQERMFSQKGGDLKQKQNPWTKKALSFQRLKPHWFQSDKETLLFRYKKGRKAKQEPHRKDPSRDRNWRKKRSRRKARVILRLWEGSERDGRFQGGGNRGGYKGNVSHVSPKWIGELYSLSRCRRFGRNQAEGEGIWR